MMIPREVAEAVAPLVGGAPVTGRRVGGGCISPSARIRGPRGDVAFLKWAHGSTPAGLFTAEARGLRALRACGAAPVPEVLGVDGDRWLLLDWLEPAAAPAEAWASFGAALAALHRAAAKGWGWPRDNFIGSLPQANEPVDDWARFWADRRLAPQLERALAAGRLDRSDQRRFEALLATLPERLRPAAGADGPSLLHGDLWSGNAHACTAGVALVDPAVYRGHREVDLAMADLFGGFPAAFWEAYQEAWPLQPDALARRPIYQLYYLLVHVNLFGSGYVDRTRMALREAGC
jgi:fructosamine-3-kinase